MKKILFILISILSFQNHAQQWNQSQKIVASDRTANEGFGESVAIEGDIAIVGTARTDGTIGLGFVGSAYIYEKNTSGDWQETQILNASDEKQNDNFGNAVAIQGNYAFVCAVKEGSINQSESWEGAVYVYERNINGVWNEIQKITPSDRDIYQRFGNSIDIQGDTLVIGSFWSNSQQGSVLIYEKDTNGVWIETQILTASDPQNSDQFGNSVSIDNDLILIGAPREEPNFTENYGAAYVFKKNTSNVWQETQKITASVREVSALFGYSVSIDGDYFVIGARGESDYSNNDFEFGAAFVFKKQANGIWTEQQRLLASDMLNGDHFGSAVRISGDNIIIGAPDKTVFMNNVTFYTYAGEAYLFKKNVTDVWIEEEIIIPSPRNSDAYFGFSVSFNNNQLIVGALDENRDENNVNYLQDAGAAYIFEDSTLRITDFVNLQRHNLYPNPSNNYIRITNSNPNDSYKIFNTLGQLCKEGLLNNEIKIQNLNSGLYFLKIENKAVINFVKK